MFLLLCKLQYIKSCIVLFIFKPLILVDNNHIKILIYCFLKLKLERVHIIFDIAP